MYSNYGYNQNPAQDYSQGPPQGYNQGPPQGYNQGPPQGYNQGPPQGYNQGPPQGYNPGAPNLGHPGAFPGQGISPEIQQWFSAVDADHSGQINAKELQAALVNGQGSNFSESVCKLMINMFDKEGTKTIDIRGFQELYHYINNWLSVFRTYDRDGSGVIEEPELSAAMQQMGFRFSPEFYKMILKNKDPENHSSITVDQFIGFSVQLQKFTEAFRAKDTQQNGTVTLEFEDFLNVAVSCLP